MQVKLLFVDDDVDTRDVVGDTLTLRGYEVVCVDTGAEALARLEHERFDAVISDLNMQGMSGLELCHRVHDAWPNLPLLLLTGFLSPETRRAALRAGAYDVLSKPIRAPEFLRAVEQATAPQPRLRRKTPLQVIAPHEPNPSPRR